MENIDLTRTEIIDLVVDYNNDNTQQMLYFIENDCNIKFDIIKVKSGMAMDNFNISIYCYKLFYNNKKSTKDFTNRYSDNKYCVYNYKAKDVLIELFKLLSDEDIENIKNIIFKVKERKQIKENNNMNVSSKNIGKNMNDNISDIKTYSNLKFYMENKPEMINLIVELEKLKNNIEYIIKEDTEFLKVIKYRLEEIEKSIQYEMPLTAIILSGSTLEGILLYIAKKNVSDFNKSKSTPKYKNSTEVKKFSEWTLNDFINVAHDVGFLKTDVQKLSHDLREFRNYIHPNEELKNDYRPSVEVSKIFIQILILAINQILEKLKA